MGAAHISKKDFLEKVFDYEKNGKDWKYSGDKPALIDFFADWCMPCKSIAPVIDELADEYRDRAYIYKVNVDEENELASLFGVRSIPALLFIPKGGMPKMAVGALPKSALKKELDSML